MTAAELLHGDPWLGPFTIWCRCSRCSGTAGSFVAAREIEEDPRPEQRAFTCASCGADLRCDTCGLPLAAHEQAVPDNGRGFIHLSKVPRA